VIKFSQSNVSHAEVQGGKTAATVKTADYRITIVPLSMLAAMEHGPLIDAAALAGRWAEC
jgi:hypothetical protein